MLPCHNAKQPQYSFYFFVQNEFSKDRRPFPPKQTPPSSIAGACLAGVALRGAISIANAIDAMFLIEALWVIQLMVCSVAYRSLVPEKRVSKF
jgi:hypothetical protein